MTCLFYAKSLAKIYGKRNSYYSFFFFRLRLSLRLSVQFLSYFSFSIFFEEKKESFTNVWCVLRIWNWSLCAVTWLWHHRWKIISYTSMIYLLHWKSVSSSNHPARVIRLLAGIVLTRPVLSQTEAERLTRPFLDALGDDYSVCCEGTPWSLSSH